MNLSKSIRELLVDVLKHLGNPKIDFTCSPEPRRMAPEDCREITLAWRCHQLIKECEKRDCATTAEAATDTGRLRKRIKTLQDEIKYWIGQTEYWMDSKRDQITKATTPLPTLEVPTGGR
jgi:hypothetical protein